jgi:hypothetical protein
MVQTGSDPSFHGGFKTSSEWQVSWLQGHLTCRAFPDISSGIMRLSSPVYSCGSAKDLHLLPFYPCLDGTAPKPVGQTIVLGLYQSTNRNVKDKLKAFGAKS